MDADRDGKLSDEEISAAASAIRQLDADGNGRLGAEAFAAAGRGHKRRG